jgi:hypothetical protein
MSAGLPNKYHAVSIACMPACMPPLLATVTNSSNECGRHLPASNGSAWLQYEVSNNLSNVGRHASKLEQQTETLVTLALTIRPFMQLTDTAYVVGGLTYMIHMITSRTSRT